MMSSVSKLSAGWWTSGSIIRQCERIRRVLIFGHAQRRSAVRLPNVLHRGSRVRWMFVMIRSESIFPRSGSSTTVRRSTSSGLILPIGIKIKLVITSSSGGKNAHIRIVARYSTSLATAPQCLQTKQQFCRVRLACHQSGFSAGERPEPSIVSAWTLKIAKRISVGNAGHVIVRIVSCVTDAALTLAGWSDFPDVSKQWCRFNCELVISNRNMDWSVPSRSKSDVRIGFSTLSMSIMGGKQDWPGRWGEVKKLAVCLSASCDWYWAVPIFGSASVSKFGDYFRTVIISIFLDQR